MNIYENHCVVYRPINPGVKIFQSSVVFYRSLLCSVPSGGAEMRGSRGKEGGRARGKKDAVISPIDHPTREPTPFLDPLHAARSSADRIFLFVIAFVIHCQSFVVGSIVINTQC